MSDRLRDALNSAREAGSELAATEAELHAAREVIRERKAMLASLLADGADIAAAVLDAVLTIAITQGTNAAIAFIDEELNR